MQARDGRHRRRVGLVTAQEPRAPPTSIFSQARAPLPNLMIMSMKSNWADVARARPSVGREPPAGRLQVIGCVIGV